MAALTALLLLLLLTLWPRDCHGVTLRDVDYVTLTRCRANCIGQFTDKPSLDTECTVDSQCASCWQLCEGLFRDPESVGVCARDERSEGQDIACRSVLQATRRYAASDVGFWHFTHAPEIQIHSSSNLTLTWSRPHARTISIDNQPLVFLVMYRDVAQGVQWSMLATTVGEEERWTGVAHFLYGQLQLQVLAVTPSGVVAQSRVSYAQPETETSTLQSSQVITMGHVTPHPVQGHHLPAKPTWHGVMQASPPTPTITTTEALRIRVLLAVGGAFLALVLLVLALFMYKYCASGRPRPQHV